MRWILLLLLLGCEGYRAEPYVEVGYGEVGPLGDEFTHRGGDVRFGMRYTSIDRRWLQPDYGLPPIRTFTPLPDDGGKPPPDPTPERVLGWWERIVRVMGPWPSVFMLAVVLIFGFRWWARWRGKRR